MGKFLQGRTPQIVVSHSKLGNPPNTSKVLPIWENGKGNRIWKVLAIGS